MKTSRHWIVDGVELIGQYLALVSHLQELVDSYLTHDSVTNTDYVLARELINEVNDMRRGIMNKILSEFDGNKMYRCIVKHAIFAYELSCELLYASPDDDELRTNQYNMSKILYKLLSKFIGTEVVSCGRCLNDIMQDGPKVTQESLFQ